MRGTLARACAVITAIAVTVTGAVSASASQPTDPRDDVLAVRAMQDALQQSAADGDVETARATLDRLGPLLAEVEGTHRALAGTAGQAAATARADLAREFPDGVARGDLPTVPALLNMLLQRLLEILAELVDNLLGAGVPIPAPPIP